MLAKLKRMNYRHVLPDLVITAFSFYASLYLRLGLSDFLGMVKILDKYIVLFVAIRMLTFAALGVYDIIWRFISLRDTVKIVRGVLLSALLVLAATYMIDIGHLPRATFLIDTCLVTLMLLGIRFARRFLQEYREGHDVRVSGRKVLLYGAGTNGRTLAHRFNLDRDVGYRLIGFIDDDPEKVGRLIAGTRVLGTRREFADILETFGVQDVIVAVTHPPAQVLREIVQTCQAHNIKPRLVTALSNANKNDGHLDTFRSVELHDLLNRPRKEIDNGAVRNFVRQRRVLVTGAGGSIGGELARQILQHNPATLLLLDHSEFNLYQIDHELRIPSAEQGPLVPLLVDIKDAATLEAVFKEYRPEIVFHAAAYKHVHLVEGNPHSAILNNVLGTRHLLDLSAQYGVETFVLISSDKAVNPVGVMGATKRLCELMVAEVGRSVGRRYCAVRFGNVLGSSGSLIPLLTNQIQRREPVTITHPDMTRYFMLIPEAVSLVLKAATIAQRGDVTLLRMGDPVKIVDVARSLIALMGSTEEETPLVFTGLRPGEKLFEELYISGDEINTSDPDILIVPSGRCGAETIGPELAQRVDRIIELAKESKPEAVHLMHSLVKESFGVAPTPAPSKERAAPLFHGGQRSELDA